MISKRDRDFKGIWIPREIYLNEELSSTEKMLLVEIHSLDRGAKGCFASTKYFADFFRVTEQWINKSLKHLAELDLIRVQKEGRLRKFYSRLEEQKFLIEKQKFPSEKQKFPENEVPSAEEGSTEPVNTVQESPNNTINNTIKNKVTTDVVTVQGQKELPHIFGKTPLLRIIKFYEVLWFNEFGTRYTANFGAIDRNYKPLLAQYTEWQIAALLIAFFNWRGVDDTDEFAHKKLKSGGFNILWMPSGIANYRLFIEDPSSTDAVNFDDAEAVKEWVRKMAHDEVVEAGKKGILKNVNPKQN